MCIRDRDKDRNKFVALFCERLGIEPVSYTHLDVYKRQAFLWHISQYNLASKFPVSYTHLDVYKRQVLMLNKIKNHISHLNSQKSFLISILTMSYGHDYKIKIVNEYREAVRQYKQFVDGAISSINELLFDKFGITNPYNMID